MGKEHRRLIARCTESENHSGEAAMLHYALVFFVIALIAAVFGFGGIAAGAVGDRQDPVLRLPHPRGGQLCLQFGTR
jgi:hypothetical protein